MVFGKKLRNGGLIAIAGSRGAIVTEYRLHARSKRNCVQTTIYVKRGTPGKAAEVSVLSASDAEVASLKPAAVLYGRLYKLGGYIMTKERTAEEIFHVINEYDDYITCYIEWEPKDSDEYFTEYYLLSWANGAKHLGIVSKQVDGHYVYRVGRRRPWAVRNIEEGHKAVLEYMQGEVASAILEV